MDAMLHTINILDLQVALRRVEGPREGQFKRGTIDFLDVGELAWGSFGLGETQVEVGRAMMHYTEKAIELALSGEIDAICSAPVNKEATRLAGYDFPGQTEFLAYLTGAKKYAMMLTLV
jgi:4-hydroxythreonine-4-phosphate dehydrogenase